MWIQATKRAMSSSLWSMTNAKKSDRLNVKVRLHNLASAHDKLGEIP